MQDVPVINLVQVLENLTLMFSGVVVFYITTYAFNVIVKSFKSVDVEWWETREHVDEIYASCMNDRHKAGIPLITFSEFIRERGIDYESLPVK